MEITKDTIKHVATLSRLAFNEEELDIYRRGRNHITHIPKNGDRLTYQCATGLEAICGYLYLTDKNRLEEFFDEVFKGGIDNE